MRSITGQALRLVLLTGCFSLFMSGLSHAIEDLVLLDANPLDDIHNTAKINAVVANGKYFSRSDLDELLAQAKAKAGKR